MKLKSRNFPHPVLHPTADDVLKSHFTGEITSQIIQDTILEFSLQFKVKNDTLNSLIQDGSAHLNVHFECASTMQRLSFKINLFDCEIKNVRNEITYETKIAVESKLLNKKVDINYFILASQDIPKYTNANMHTDFSDATFSIEKGDILALAITQTLHLEKEQLLKTSSIFKISKSDFSTAPFTIGMNNDQINIIFPENMHRRIGQFNELYGENANKILIQMIYYPALLDVFHKLQTLDRNELEDFEVLDWYITLEKKLRSMGQVIDQLNSDTLPSLAYTILYEDIETPWTALENILIREESEANDEQ